MSETNHALSKIFSTMAAIYNYLGAEERFRVLAYNKASRTIDRLKDDVTVFIMSNTLEEIPGIGESIADKINQYVKTGRNINRQAGRK